MTKQESLDFLDNCIEYINHLSPKKKFQIYLLLLIKIMKI